VACDAGRCVRPLYIVNQSADTAFPSVEDVLYKPEYGKMLEDGRITLSDVYIGSKAKGVPTCLEFLDVLESNTRMIAMHRGKIVKNCAHDRAIHYKYTHMELSPSL
jgi:hypothetical protein